MSRRMKAQHNKAIYEADTVSIDASLSDFAPSENSLPSPTSSFEQDKKGKIARSATSDLRLPAPSASAQRLDLDTSTRTSKTLRPLPTRASTAKTLTTSQQKGLDLAVASPISSTHSAPSRKNSGRHHMRNNTNSSTETDLISSTTADDSFGPLTQSFDRDASPEIQMPSSTIFPHMGTESEAEDDRNLIWSPPLNKFSPMQLPPDFASAIRATMRKADKSSKSSVVTEMTATPTKRPLFHSHNTNDTAIRVVSQKDVSDDADTTPTKTGKSPTPSKSRRSVMTARNWFRGKPYNEASVTTSEESDIGDRVSEEDTFDESSSRSERESSGDSHSQRLSSNDDHDDVESIADLNADDYSEDEDEVSMAARTALPPGSLSPCKETPPPAGLERTRSVSPVKREQASMSPVETFAARSSSPEKRGSPAKARSASPLKQPISPSAAAVASADKSVKTEEENADEPSDNYIRFSVRADVMQRTRPIEQFVNWARTFRLAPSIPSPRWLCLIALLIGFFSMIMYPLSPPLPPDISVLSSFAMSFEPAIYYSETGVTQVQNVQNMRLAVWDLGESIRLRDIPNSSPLIEEISVIERSLKMYTSELSRFFAQIDGDIDQMLSTLDWAHLSLRHVAKEEAGLVTTLIARIDDALCRVGLAAPSYTTNLTEFSLSTFFGPSTVQRTRRAVNLAFIRLFAVLETSVRKELARTANLLGYLNAVDMSFLNLRTLTGTLLSEQEREESEILSSLWQRALGKTKHLLTKYEGNRELLSALKQHTIESKRLLLEHNSKLLMLQSSLNVLEHKFASPSMRSAIRDTVNEMTDSDSLTIELELPAEMGENVKDFVSRITVSSTVGSAARHTGSAGESTSARENADGDTQADAGQKPKKKNAEESFLGTDQHILDDLLAVYDIWEQIEKVAKTHRYLSGLRTGQRRKVMDSFFAPPSESANANGEKRLKIEGR